MIGAAGPLFVAIAIAALPHVASPPPARGSAKAATPPKLEPLRADRPTAAQRVMPGLH